MKTTLAFVTLFAACGRAPEHSTRMAATAPAVAPAASVPATIVVVPTATGPSLYQLPLALRDGAGRTIALDVDRGHPTLISMFYGSCTVACPALVGELAHAVAELSPAVRAQTRVLLVSFDPARDTPARLTELSHEHHLDARWTLAAAATDEDARALAGVLGVKYRRLADGQFFHNTIVIALDRDGRPTARMTGLGDPSVLEATLAAIATE